MSEPFIGEIRIMPYTFAPRHWAWCQGQIMQIASNTALYALIGTTYGGDGRVTFALPDLKARVPMHPGRGPGLTNRVLGEKTGTDTVALSADEMPSHNHKIQVSSLKKPKTNEPGSGRLPHMLTDNRPKKAYVKSFDPDSSTSMADSCVSNTGSSQAHENRQPFLGVNFCIALDGVFPSRS